MIIAIIAIITYTKDHDNSWSFDETRFEKISRNKRAVLLVSLFLDRTEGRRGNRGP